MCQVKPSKNQKKQHRTTLDQKHQNFINEYRNNIKELIPKKYALQTKQDELKDIIDKNRVKASVELVAKISGLKNEIENLQDEIHQIECGDRYFEYSIKNYDLLKQYYDMKKNGNDSAIKMKPNRIIKPPIKDGENKKYRDKGIMSYFKTTVQQTTVQQTTENKTNKLQGMNLKPLHEKFLSMNDDEYVTKTKGYTRLCPRDDCGKELIISFRDGSYYCECGFIETSLVSIEKINYKEPSQEKNTNNAYRRVNHLTEIMSQIQANESTEIPQAVFIDIRRELKKKKINKARLDIFMLRRILKRLKKSKYYEHTPHILQIINGKEPPKFTKHHENKIKQMFRDIQKPFEIYRPPNRKNFLSYSYVLHKFCELLELDQYLDYFPLLKNINKLKQHDKIWKSICAHMKWKYYAST